MRLTINGDPREMDAATVRQLVERMGLGRQAVAVEVNQQVVPRQHHEQTELHEGDVIEVVTLVGGG